MEDKKNPAGCMARLMALLLLASISPLVAAQATGEPGVSGDSLELAASGQNTGLPVHPQEYGLVDATTLSLSPWAFIPYDSNSEGKRQAATSLNYCSSACSLVANLDVPAGARITGIELDAYDDEEGAMISGGIAVCGKGIAGCTGLFAPVLSGIAELPGNVLLTGTTELTVNNNTMNYRLEVDISGGGQFVGFYGARVYYRRQISPAPGTATFSDVPNGHTFYAGIEALAASGITGGCGGGKFCPDDPVTRGQMATFLARALGLHWD